MAEANSFSRDELLAELSYSPETGAFHWLGTGKGRNNSGEAGVINKSLGYRMIGFKRRRYYAHRLAWLITYGEWPPAQIDHINGDRADNRICNLRCVTHAENQANRHNPRSNKHGLRGVDITKEGRYRARLVYQRKKHNVGVYDTPEEAHAAYLAARTRINPFAANNTSL